MPARIASINSFGYGGSNAHVVLQDAESYLRGCSRHQTSSLAAGEDDIFAGEEEPSMRPRVLVFSANDEHSLKAYCRALKNHLLNPAVMINIDDLAYTLSERRSRHFNRGYALAQSTDFDEGAVVYGKSSTEELKIGFIFTGQGAQWSQMGKCIVEAFPSAKALLKRLDDALQSLPNPPQWSLKHELVEARKPEHLRRPEFSQPLVTALQLIQLSALESWGINAQSVIGHSSGEIAAACAAGHLTPEDAIKIAFYRGQAAKDLEHESDEAMGMMAVGLGAIEVEQYISDSARWVAIACYNSPHSVTLSGKTSELEKVKTRLQADSHFARLLQVNLAYHSKYMYKIGDHYERLLQDNVTPAYPAKGLRCMYSTVTGSRLDQTVDASYWKTNMVSPVRFDQACRAMLTEKDGPNFFIELGPSGALAGPFSQIRKELPGQGSNIQYIAAAKRGPDSAIPMFDVAGRLFISGGQVDFAKVNEEEHNPERPFPATIIDLPNYVWNHSTKYWHESDASKDWRFRPFLHHDLLGSKILGTPWNAPIFKKSLNLKDVPWLNDHKMGTDTLFPASGYISMAIEALYQSIQSTDPVERASTANQLRYRLRNVKFYKALVLEDGSEAKIMLTLSAHPGTKDSWHDFRVFSLKESMRIDHCEGLIRHEQAGIEGACLARLVPSPD